MAKKTNDLQPAPYNPRKISPAALSGLKESLRVFGDLSGIVWNRRTGHLVCGHQRREAVGGFDSQKIVWGQETLAKLGHVGSRFEALECTGIFSSKDGITFHVRQVDWDESFEKAANVAANSPLLQGEFSDLLPKLLEEIKIELPTFPAVLRFDELIAGLDKVTSQPAPAVDVSTVYQLVVTCRDEGDQEKMFTRLKQEGYECRVLTL